MPIFDPNIFDPNFFDTEEAESIVATRTVYIMVSEAGVTGTLRTHTPRQLATGHHVIAETIAGTSSSSGKLAFAGVPVGAEAVIEVPAAGYHGARALRLVVPAGTTDHDATPAPA